MTLARRDQPRRVTPELMAYYKKRAHELRTEACRDAWDGILAAQLDYRTRPCNFVEIMPRLDEHLRRPKAKGASA